VVIMGGEDWQRVVPGQLIRTAGKLRPPDAGKVEAGILAASSAPLTIKAADVWTSEPASLGRQFAGAAAWLDADARGLLPGMVTGDTSGLDEQLKTAMKTVGLTHLTAVSGANCSLILGVLLLAARSLRLARLPAAALALAGLGLFVLMVGPDASVLRAALMGAIALASLAGGRTGRGLSFLCLAVIGLLLIDPGLGTSFGFLSTDRRCRLLRVRRLRGGQIRRQPSRCGSALARGCVRTAHHGAVFCHEHTCGLAGSPSRPNTRAHSCGPSRHCRFAGAGASTNDPTRLTPLRPARLGAAVVPWQA
jgi:hypothetical protein